MFRHTHYNIPHPCTFFHHFRNICSIHSRTTRLSSNPHNYYRPRYRSNKLQRSLNYQGVKIRNSLPNNLKEKLFYHARKSNKNTFYKFVLICTLSAVIIFIVFFFFFDKHSVLIVCLILGLLD